LADPKKIYWDSCVWIALINREPKVDACDYHIELARKGEVQIWTSSLTIAEVYKAKSEAGPKALLEAQELAFLNFVDQDFVYEVQLDHDIATMARALCRKHAPLKKPNDGVHIATAAMHNVDELHTFDRDDLLPLNGLVMRLDQKPLVVCRPPNRPLTEEPDPRGRTEPLF